MNDFSSGTNFVNLNDLIFCKAIEPMNLLNSNYDSCYMLYQGTFLVYQLRFEVIKLFTQCC